MQRRLVVATAPARAADAGRTAPRGPVVVRAAVAHPIHITTPTGLVPTSGEDTVVRPSVSAGRLDVLARAAT